MAERKRSASSPPALRGKTAATAQSLLFQLQPDGPRARSGRLLPVADPVGCVNTGTALTQSPPRAALLGGRVDDHLGGPTASSRLTRQALPAPEGLTRKRRRIDAPRVAPPQRPRAVLPPAPRAAGCGAGQGRLAEPEARLRRAGRTRRGSPDSVLPRKSDELETVAMAKVGAADGRVRLASTCGGSKMQAHR